MKHRIHTTIFKRDDLLDIVENIEKSLKSGVLVTLDSLMKESKGKTELVDSMLFSTLNLKSDDQFFSRLEKVILKYSKITTVLKQKIEEDLPDTITSNTSNLNAKLVLSLISEGIFLGTEVIGILNYIVNNFYTKSSSELEKSIKLRNANKLITLVKVIPELEKADFDKIVDAIGNIPTIKTLRQEETSTIPVELVMDFFKENLAIKDFYTQTLAKRFIGFFNYKSEKRKHSDIAKNFIGNPIYHIRLFLIDLQSMRLEKYKDEVRLLELRLLELKNNNLGTEDAKISKAIEYYENKINKVNAKIEKLLEID